MADLHSDFDKEQDLGAAFEKEADLGASADPSQLETMAQAGIHGASFGLDVPVAGLAQAALGSDDSDQGLSFGERYAKYRDLRRKTLEDAEKANPKTFLASELAGGLLIPGLGELGAASKLGKVGKALGTATAALRPTSVAGAAGLGAAMGAVPGASDLDVEETAKGAGLGAGLGAAGGLVGKGLGKLVSPSSRGEMASKLATGAAGIPENIPGTGTTLLEQGILKGGTSPKEILKNIGSSFKVTEDKLKGHLGKAENILINKNPDEILLKVGKTEDKVKDIFNEWRTHAESMSDETSQNIIDNITPIYESYVEKLQNAGNSVIDLNNVKRSIYNEIQRLSPDAYPKIPGIAPNRNLGDKVEFLKDLGNTVKNQIENLGDLAGGDIGSSIKSTNSEYQKLIDANTSINSLIKKESRRVLGEEEIGIPKTLFGTIYKAGSAGIESAKKPAMGKLASMLQGSTKLGGEAISPYVSKAPSSASAAYSGTRMPESETHSLSNAMYNADDNTLKNFLQALSTDPEFSHVAKSLSDAIASGDRNKKNAALFSIAQKTKARELFKGMQ